jgi:hypothetical protein
MEQPPLNPSRPLARGPARPSTPLMDLKVYRPGSALAVCILLLPAAAALLAAALALNTSGRVPLWLPFVLLLCVLGLPVLWLAMQSVRTSTLGIAMGRPWQTWNEIPWAAIERVEQVGPRLRIMASDDRQLTIWPALLRDAGRLERELLLRLPPQVLAGKFATRGQIFVGGIPGTVQVQAQPRWRGITAAACLLGPVLLVGGLVALPHPVAWAVALVAGLVELAVLALLLAISQRVTLDDTGIRVSGPLHRGARSMRWRDVELIEKTPRERVLRLRGTKKLVCLGPGMLPPHEGALMRTFIQEYCRRRAVPMFERRWLF